MDRMELNKLLLFFQTTALILISINLSGDWGVGAELCHKETTSLIGFPVILNFECDSKCCCNDLKEDAHCCTCTRDWVAPVILVLVILYAVTIFTMIACCCIKGCPFYKEPKHHGAASYSASRESVEVHGTAYGYDQNSAFPDGYDKFSSGQDGSNSRYEDLELQAAAAVVNPMYKNMDGKQTDA